MPTITNSRYPKPLGWDEFESICLSSCGLRWSNPNLTRHGRQGQKQQGVDIYGNDNLQRLVGVQCKNTISSLTTTLIDKEIKNAESFMPSLSSLFIATSADSDVALQSYVRKISDERHRENKFTVDIIFWDSILHDLSRDAKEVEKHYPQFFSSLAPINPENIKRDRDIAMINELLMFIDIDSTEHYLSYGPKYIEMKFIEHITCFRGKINSDLFQLYDQYLTERLFNWLNKWQEIGSLVQSAPYNYNYHSDRLSFNMPGDFCQTLVDHQKYEAINQAIDQFFPLQAEFCKYIRENYFEVDLKATSAKARRLYA
ncbi:hypothetical protein ACQYWY_00665 [Comamonas sediminis]|uniref:hypothetical protein n=1 Tax=Comamonas sediminis TaxID=1783360 RepID=UPI003D2DC1A0